MKKTLALVLAVLMLVSVCAFGASAEAGKGKDSVAEAVYGTPAIDGTIDDIWAKATPQKFSTTTKSGPNGGNILSSAFDAGQFRVMWDTNAIYVLAEINDTTMITSSAEWSDIGHWVERDGIGIAFGGNWTNASAQNNPIERTWALVQAHGVMANYGSDNNNVFVCDDLAAFSALGKDQNHSPEFKKNYAVAETAAGYLVEWKVNLKNSKYPSIAALELKENATIPFDIWVDAEDDGTGLGRNAIYTWADPKAGSSNNNTTKGTLKLVDNASAYLKETVPAGKTDVLANKEGFFLCDPAVSSSAQSQGTLFTDGVISADKNNTNILNRIHLNTQCANDGYAASVEFPGLNGKYYYAVQFNGLNNVAVDEFALYYGAQKDGSLQGRDIPTGQCDKDIAILYSTDNGASYKVAFESNVGDFGGNATYVTSVTNEAVNGGSFDYRKATITLSSALEGVTNLVYAAKSQRPNSATWPARVTEFSAFSPKATTPDPTPATGDNTAIFALFAVVALMGTAYVVVRKVRG